ncbi:single-stranded-DNA-specific exonuclease RecJ [Alkalibacterium iburiense]|uniref:Single-stranded-DNA-specific exonuclease RecJ n=2 Tax=Alkalibacterium iburiense TaxID=290589 RepID=A0ABN0X3W7_9LACT
MQKMIWEIPDKTIDETKVDALAAEMNASKTFIKLCMNRGLHTKEAIDRFINPTADWFHDPFTLYEMDKTVERIQEALTSGQKITVYGDYDADGVTSTVILYEAIEMLGGQVDYYIPNRFIEGYGPNVEAFNKLIENGTELIITVDNGVAGHEAITHANTLGIDVIVTDHHECPKELPDAYSIVHPRHPKGNYACPDLSGAGVSLKVATALLGEIPEELLDLAAIGTIADLVSLTGENRAIAYFGLKWMKHSQRIGLLALLAEGSIPLESIDEETVGFKIAPPINAVGRLGDATLVVDLLTTFDDEEAQRLSRIIINKNEERKALVNQITLEAFDKLEEQSDQAIVVLHEPGWHEGVLGIVASKVADKVSKPTIILTSDPNTEKVKGSGRSINGFNIYECMNEIRDYLSHFGGHEMACGLSLEMNQLDAFIEAVNRQAEQLMEDSESYRKLDISGIVEWEDISIDLIDELNALKPFGQENEKPLFKLESLLPDKVKIIGADQSHLKASLVKNEKQLEMIAFQSAEWEEVWRSSPKIDVVGYLDINEWNGNKKVQLTAADFKTQDSVIIDYRKEGNQKRLFSKVGAHYLFFKKEHFNKWKPHITRDSTGYLLDENKDLPTIHEADPVVFMDIPDELSDFEKVFRNYKDHTLYLFFYSPHEYYFKGVPKREQFTKLYKWLLKNKTIHLANETEKLKKVMKLDSETLKFMIMVFLENEFVTIEDGKLSIRSQPQKKNLEDTITYQKRLAQIKTEETLVYSSFNELVSYLREI